MRKLFAGHLVLLGGCVSTPHSIVDIEVLNTDDQDQEKMIISYTNNYGKNCVYRPVYGLIPLENWISLETEWL